MTDIARSISDFLLARIAEDEARAEDFELDTARGIDGQYGSGGMQRSEPYWNGAKEVGFLPERIRAECAAKRAIVALAQAVHQIIDGEWSCYSGCEGDAILETLARVWSDHEQFDAAWAES